MAKLWEVEAAARGQSPDGRVAARQATSAAVVNELFALWQKTLPRISGKSKLAEAIRYATSRRSIFEHFLSDGRIELDSNIVERAIRPQTITRKNSPLAGSDGALIPKKSGPFITGVFRDNFPAGKRSGSMKASKFSDAQKAFILKQGDDGVPVAEICRKAGISQATYFNWRKKYAGLLPDEMRRLKALEDENSRLKKIVADLTLDREMLQDVIRRKL